MQESSYKSKHLEGHLVIGFDVRTEVVIIQLNSYID